MSKVRIEMKIRDRKIKLFKIKYVIKFNLIFENKPTLQFRF